MSRRYLITLALLWVAGGIAGLLYAQQQNIPAAIAVAAAIALLTEGSAYASLAFDEVRTRWHVVPLVVLAPVPYMIYSTAAGVFTLRSMLLLWTGAAAVTLWFRILPKTRWTDLAFILFMAAPLLFGWFSDVFQRPLPRLRLEILGQLLWIRLGVLAVLRDRPQRGIHFGFIPTAAECRTGLLYGALAVAAVLPLALYWRFSRFAPADVPWWQLAGAAAGTFLGILWVVALSEEFFFRGLLQQWLEAWTGNTLAALAAASVLFGSAHLGFRVFPNWEMAALATIAGIFYGLAFRRGNGIRAAMVAHAFLVTVWRVAFR